MNAHATSTLVGDVAELKAIRKVFTDTKHMKINGTKSMIGHSLGASLKRLCSQGFIGLRLVMITFMGLDFFLQIVPIFMQPCMLLSIRVDNCVYICLDARLPGRRFCPARMTTL